MCKKPNVLFQVYCDFSTFKGVKSIQKLCVLSQNKINEKIYFALWFWYIFTMVLISLHLIFRFGTIISRSWRRTLLSHQLKSTFYAQIHKNLERFLKYECDAGDWFIIYQIGTNVDPYFYQEFIRALLENCRKRAKEEVESENNLEDVEIMNKSNV